MLTPLPEPEWDYDKAAHLLNRAAFGGTPKQIEAAHKRGLNGAIHDLIDVPDGMNEAPAPEWARPRDLRKSRAEMEALKEGSQERLDKMREARELQAAQILELRQWWLNRMKTSRYPLREKMTLFWHGHFATSFEKVNDAYLMWLQNDTFRKNSLGNFKLLTKQVSRDPAMMIYLDLQQSQKAHPNENWARELMELFTVGIGHYSEADIRESARAFTGYRVDDTNQQFKYVPAQHDDTDKAFMGKSGPWNGDDIVDLLTEQPACAEFIASKIWRYFVDDKPADNLVAALADRFRAHGYEIRWLLRDIFGSTEFFSANAMRSQIKSPVQFLVTTTKLLESELPPPKVSQNALAQMGQALFAPPNVKGWDGGKAWISTSTLLFRYNFAGYLINGDGPRSGGDDAKQPKQWLSFYRSKVIDSLIAPSTPRPPLAVAPQPTPSPSPPVIPFPAPELRRAPANVNAIVPLELRARPKELIAHLATRIFQCQLPEHETEIFSRYLEERAPNTDDAVIRGLIHLMMSTPQFQLN